MLCGCYHYQYLLCHIHLFIFFQFLLPVYSKAMDDFIENLETLTLDNNNLPQTDDVSICYLIV